jgi:hypothetical protein
LTLRSYGVVPFHPVGSLNHIVKYVTRYGYHYWLESGMLHTLNWFLDILGNCLARRFVCYLPRGFHAALYRFFNPGVTGVGRL